MPKAKLSLVADPEAAFIAATRNMPDGYLECRGSQHRFNVVEPFRIVDSTNEKGRQPHMGHDKYAMRVLECDRCIDPETGHGMIRHDFYEITSRRGHTFLRKINASYLAPWGYYVEGVGRIQGNRGLVLGMALDRSMSDTPLRGRGRPKAGA